MKISRKAKVIFSAAALTVLFCAASWGETHETYNNKLSTSIGDISFGAWGRSTFELGQEKTTTKITADATSLGNQAVTGWAQAESQYSALGGTKSSSDDGYAEDVISTLSTAAGTQAALAGGDSAAVAAAAQTTASQLTSAYAGTLLVNTLKAMETDDSDTDNYAALDPDWSYGSRVGFWIIGRTHDEKFGFDFNLDSDARALFVHKLYDADEDDDDVNYNEDGKYAVAIGDQAKIWAVLDADKIGLSNKIAFGKMREQVLRGSIGDFGQRESSDVKSEDDIFSEFWPTTGLFISTTGMEGTPLEGFYAAGAIDISPVLHSSAGDTDRTENLSLYDAMRTAQAGIGYTVPGIAQFKAQYWGDSISEINYKYAVKKYKAAREAGYDSNDYYGRMEFGIDYLGFMGGATSFLDPNLDLEKTPNANLIELGFKVPIVTREGLRDYDPEKFYNWYACLGTMGVIQKGFILYKGHIWGGQGTSNLSQYTDVTGSGSGLITMDKGDGADIFMAGIDFLAEVCLNPFGKQDVFVGLSGNYNITSASADGGFSFGTNSLTVDDLELRQHKFAAELYLKKTFAANNYLFAGIAGNFSVSTMDGTVSDVVDLSYKGTTRNFYMPIGVELFF